MTMVYYLFGIRLHIHNLPTNPLPMGEKIFSKGNFMWRILVWR